MLGSIIGGALLGTALGAGQSAWDKSFNAKEAQKQRNWETQMSNTAYQRAVADMEAAGLNAQQIFSGSASGASTPSGASAASANSGSNLAQDIAQLTNSASQFIRSGKQNSAMNRVANNVAAMYEKFNSFLTASK